MKNIIESIFKLKLLRNKVYQGQVSGSFNKKQLFGGFIVAQGISVGYNIVPDNFFLHNIHVYYLRRGIPNNPVNYEVLENTESKNFRKLIVSVKQNDVIISNISMSFKGPEKSKYLIFTPKFHSKSKFNQLLDFEEILKNPSKVSPILADNANKFRNWLQDFPFILRPVDPNIFKDEETPTMSYWFSLKPDIDIPRNPKTIVAVSMPLAFTPNLSNQNIGINQTLIAFLSDYGIVYPLLFRNPTFKTGLVSSLDHNIWFHSNNFDIKQNFLTENRCLYANDALTLNISSISAESGQLIATATQQGIVRKFTSETTYVPFSH